MIITLRRVADANVRRAFGDPVQHGDVLVTGTGQGESEAGSGGG